MQNLLVVDMKPWAERDYILAYAYADVTSQTLTMSYNLPSTIYLFDNENWKMKLKKISYLLDGISYTEICYTHNPLKQSTWNLLPDVV